MRFEFGGNLAEDVVFVDEDLRGIALRLFRTNSIFNHNNMHHQSLLPSSITPLYVT